MNLLDSLLRGSQSSIPELVEALREIHENRAADSESRANPARLLTNPFSPFLRGSPIAGLTRGSENLARLLESALKSDMDARPDGPKEYRELRDGVERMERDARRHADLVDRLTQQVPQRRTSDLAAFYQETLYLRCPRGGHSGGRFQCENQRKRRTSVTALRHGFTAGGEPLATPPALSLRPEALSLEEGEIACVQLDLDLAPCADLGPGAIASSIDLVMDGSIALKLWIEVDVYEPA
jgi:hypothetical protein